MFESDDGLRLQGFNLRDVIGRTIVCDDGVKRKVEQISHSFRYPTRVLINEVNEDETPGGSWVHALSLSCQMMGNPLPTPEQRAAFDRVMSAMSFVPDPEHQRGDLVTLPSGLKVYKQHLEN